MKPEFRYLFPIFITLGIILLFKFTKILALKFYPAVMNFFIFTIFFSSLFTKQTIIQKFAQIMENKKELDEKTLSYTRNLTYVWVLFTFINLIISILTIFADEKIWAIYNGFISYILIGIIFGVEYPIRLAFKRKHNL